MPFRESILDADLMRELCYECAEFMLDTREYGSEEQVRELAEFLVDMEKEYGVDPGTILQLAIFEVQALQAEAVREALTNGKAESGASLEDSANMDEYEDAVDRELLTNFVQLLALYLESNVSFMTVYLSQVAVGNPTSFMTSTHVLIQ